MKRMKKIGLCLSFLGSILLAHGQMPLDSILTSIARNNPTLIASAYRVEAQNLGYQTGLTPYNPQVGMDYMVGTPANAGNQTDFTVTQAFDFPTAYAQKKQLSEEQIATTEFQHLALRQRILLEAKTAYLELIYRNKLKFNIDRQKKDAEKWLEAFQKRLEKGEGNILDVNKAKLQLLEINSTEQENATGILLLHQKLAALNGGNPIMVTDTLYPTQPILPPFEALEKEIEANDPTRKYLAQQIVIQDQEIAVTKSMALPKMEIGYHYQGILGQRYNGAHLGLSLPLWENRNQVRAKEAEMKLAEAELQSHRQEHYAEILRQYAQTRSQKALLMQYEALLPAVNTAELLEKSLALGQISTIEYFLEISFYFETLQKYLQAELDYHQAMAELLKHQL